jgi:hypothetical protein
LKESIKQMVCTGSGKPAAIGLDAFQHMRMRGRYLLPPAVQSWPVLSPFAGGWGRAMQGAMLCFQQG